MTGVPDSNQNHLAELYAAIAGLEAQRQLLGDAIVNPALESLRATISALEADRDQPVPESETSEERNIVTVLFADIVGSTAMASRLDPEDWHGYLTEVHRMVGGIVEANGGLVVHYLGDGLLAIFGAQKMSEMDAENAVRAGLEIQLTLAQRPVVPTLQMRVGIHTGLVFLGKMGTTQKQEFSASGKAMNLAARLQAEAPPGGVLVSHETYRQTRGRFEFIKQQLIGVKGIVEPVQTYLVNQVQQRSFLPATRGVPGMNVCTVGRDVEWQQMKSWLAGAVEQRQVAWVQLVGHPGIGKSRLLAEMAAHIGNQPGVFFLLKARASQGDENQAYALVRRLWFDCFQIAEDSPLEDAEAHWMEQFVALWGSGAEEPAQVLGILAGLPFRDSRYIGAMRQDPIQFKGRATVVSCQLIDLLRARQPVVILFEDLQWADASSWDYLTRVLLNDNGKAHGLFVLGTARPEWKPVETLLAHTGYHPINLPPLSNDACRQIASGLLQRVEGMPETALQQVVERSEGIPYFVEEIVNWFLDRGVIEQQEDSWRFVPERMEALPLPTTLQHLLLTRLDSLMDVERLALQRGAIFGRIFWEGGLEALGSLNYRSTLERLRVHDLVERQAESTLEGEIEWSFHHNLLYEVAYESILKRERRRMHRLAGAWLEMLLHKIGRLEEYSGRLGEHAERAGEMEVAADWYLMAGKSAKARGALLEARRFFERALELTLPADRDQRWQISVELTEVLGTLGETHDRQANDAALVAMAQEAGNDHWLAEALYHQGFYIGIAGNLAAELQAYDLALDASRRAGDRAREGLILPLKVFCLTRLGRMADAETAAQEALAMARSLENETILARALTNLAIYAMDSGNIAGAARLLIEQVEIVQRLGDRMGQIVGLANLGYSYLFLGLYEDGRAALEKSLQQADAIGARRESAYNRLNLAVSHYRSNDLAAARRILEDTTPELRALRNIFGQASAESYLGMVCEACGEYISARQFFQEAREHFQKVGAYGGEKDAQAGMARCCAATGDYDQARQHLTELWEFCQQHGASGLEFPVLAYQTCAKGFESLGDHATAAAAIEKGYQEVMARAARIDDPAWRESFLNNVPEHRTIILMWQSNPGSSQIFVKESKND